MGNQGRVVNKYSKYGNRQSPYISKNPGNVVAMQRDRSSKLLLNTGVANTDSELYAPSIHARQGPTAIGSGTRNVPVSLQQRQQERREKEKAVLKEVETQKKAVLDKINSIQSKKFS
jgi:hypothetical protein